MYPSCAHGAVWRLYMSLISLISRGACSHPRQCLECSLDTPQSQKHSEFIWEEEYGERDVEFVEHIRGASRVGVNAGPEQLQNFSYPEGLVRPQQSSELPADNPRTIFPNGATSFPISRNRPDSAFSGPPDETATESGSQGKNIPTEATTE
eukprot:jgi/Botrbrau1/10406/Bobra.0133s0015.1